MARVGPWEILRVEAEKECDIPPERQRYYQRKARDDGYRDRWRPASPRTLSRVREAGRC